MSLATHGARSEDSDQTGRIPRLIIGPYSDWRLILDSNLSLAFKQASRSLIT